MTSLRLNQVKTSLNAEGQQAVGEDGDLKFESTSLQQNKLVADVKYDSKKGQLVFIRKNGELVTIGGLPTLSMFGTGLPGKKGATGNTGKDGRDGRDGSTGVSGCEGQPGERGLNGEDGTDGEDGEEGVPGDDGYQGQPGEPGPTGPDGPDGPIGPRGNDGPNCIAGATGAQGPAPIETAVVSSTVPTDPRVSVWLYPTANVTPAPNLPVIQALTASVSSVSTVATRTAPNTDMFSSQAYLPVNVRGGVGPYRYQWAITTMDGVSLVSPNASTVEIYYGKRLGLGANIVLKGTIRCTVTDMGQTSRPTYTASAAVSIVAYNPSGTSSKGCIVFGSTVMTMTGQKDVADLRVGDNILGLSRQPKAFRKWFADSIKGRPLYATVKALVYGTETHYYIINGQKFTHEHPILVHDSKHWRYVAARDVEIGFLTIARAGHTVPVIEHTRIEADVHTVDIDVEPYDCFFVGDVLAHNADLVSLAEKT